MDLLQQQDVSRENDSRAFDISGITPITEASRGSAGSPDVRPDSGTEVEAGSDKQIPASVEEGYCKADRQQQQKDVSRKLSQEWLSLCD